MSFSLRLGAVQYVIIGDEFIVGRGRGVHLALDDDPSVSRRHALFKVEQGLLTLRDLKSRNGTRVNGQPIVGLVRLEVGDDLQLGCTRILVVETTDLDIHPEQAGTTQPIDLSRSQSTIPPRLESITAREREVLTLLAAGVAQREIARNLGVSVKTVQTYRTRIGQKLGLNNREELVRFALQMGILKSGSDG